MSIFKTLTYNIGSYYYFLREIISPSLIRDAKEIPIIINNFNRLTTLRLLTETLTACGYTNIYILDNASTYPPLLEYYKTCPFTVFHLNQNLGFKALWKSPLKKRFCNDYYIYTDSDVIPSDYCPKDFIDYFFKELKKEGIQEGEIKGTIKMSKKFNVSKDDTMKNIINEFSLTKDKAQEYIEKLWFLGNISYK